jgi:hypothetical protein
VTEHGADGQPAIEQPVTPSVRDAATVFAAFEHDEAKATSDMANKWIVVKGRVERVGKDMLGTPFVTLTGDEGQSSVCIQCMFKKTDPGMLSGLKPGQTAIIAGKCRGKMGTVLLAECRFYDAAK